MYRNLRRLAAAPLLATGLTAFAADSGKPTVRWAQVAILPPGTNDTRQTEVVTPPATEVPSTAMPTPTAVPTPAGATPGGPATIAPGVVLPGGGSATGGAAPAASSPPSAPGCSVALANPSAVVGHEGGIVRLSAQFTPANCAREPVSSVRWIRRMEGDAQAGIPLAVEPNPARAERSAVLRIGDASFTVRQEGARFAAFAVAPARLEFAGGQKKQSIVAWSDDPNVTYAAVVVPAVSWLKLVPEARNAGRQRFVVEVASQELKPGKQEAVVEISSPGSVAPSVRIPVTAVAEERKK